MASYEPKQWQCGDTITADDLNRMEQGIANAGGGGTPLIVRAQSFVKENGSATLTFDKTWQQVHDAIENGVPTYLGVSSISGPELCQAEDYYFNDPMLIPIYQVFENDGAYEVSAAEDGMIDPQSDPNALMINTADCGEA